MKALLTVAVGLYLPQHGVGQLADLLHVLGADVQLAAADPQQGAVGELLPIQLHLDEVVLARTGVLDSHLQHQLWWTATRRRTCDDKD